VKGSGGSLTQLERLKNTTTSDIIGTKLKGLNNVTQNGVISWHTSGDAEEHYKEGCNILAHYWRGSRTLQTRV